MNAFYQWCSSWDKKNPRTEVNPGKLLIKTYLLSDSVYTFSDFYALFLSGLQTKSIVDTAVKI